MRIISCTIMIAFAVLSLTGRVSAAPVETVLYSFTGSGLIGPRAGLIADNQGALYGTTVGAGNGCPQLSTGGCGTVFKLTPPAKAQTIWTESLLYSFKGGSDASGPWAGLIADNQGALYGTTEFGVGSGCQGAGCGTVFKLTPPAKGQTTGKEIVLYSFCSLPNCSDGADPVAGLIADNQGALYGTTYGGGSSSNGTVFKLTPPAKGQTTWTESVLYSFKGGSDGSNPVAGLNFDDQGALYGTTAGGGNSCLDIGSCGTVFKLTPPSKRQTTWTESVIYSFKGGSDGSDPRAGLITDDQGVLYGTTTAGGAGNGIEPGCFGTFNQISLGCGTVFKLTPPTKGQTTWTETVLYSFLGGSDGAQPTAGLIFNDRKNVLYGTTQVGGSEVYRDAIGTIFKLISPTQGQTVWTESILYSFKGGSDGAQPTAGLIIDKQDLVRKDLALDRLGGLYGTTSGGGSGNTGIVFKLSR